MELELNIQDKYFMPTLTLSDSFKKKNQQKKQMKGRRSLRSVGIGYSGSEDLELITQHDLDIVEISNGSKDDNGLRYKSKHAPIQIVKFDDFTLDLD